MWRLFDNDKSLFFQVPSGALLNKTIPGKYEDGEYKMDKCSMYDYNNQTNVYSNNTGKISEKMENHTLCQPDINFWYWANII